MFGSSTPLKKRRSAVVKIIAIGYSFGETDRVSYAPLLEVLRSHSGSSLKVIAPDAKDITRRVARDYPNLAIAPFEDTFDHWVDAGFP